MTFDLARGYFAFPSPGFQRVVDGVRMLVFEVAADEKLDGLIFTFVYALEQDDAFVDRVVGAVESRDGQICFVRLDCDPAVLETRIAAPERARFGKLTDTGTLRDLRATHRLHDEIPGRDSLTIDTAHVAPGDAARMIADRYSLSTSSRNR